MFLTWLRGHKSKAPRHKPWSPPRARPRVEALEDRTVPASFTVTRGTGTAFDVGSLPWAVAQVNGQTDTSNSINFQPSVTSVVLTTGTLVLQQNVTITGNGSQNTGIYRDTSPPTFNFKIFKVEQSVTASINDLTIGSGYASAFDADGGIGGGIRNDGSLTLDGVTLSQNHAASKGGAIANFGYLACETVTFQNNTSNDYAGALYNKGTAELTTSIEAWGNSATADGGAFYNDVSASLTLTGANVHNNTASRGGGVFNEGTLDWTGGALQNNRATGTSGGGLWSSGSATVDSIQIMGNSANGYGGGVYVQSNTTTVSNSTFSGNTANSGGTGGAWESGASLVLTNDQIMMGQTFIQVP